jgi:hypothetical protein
VVSAGISQAYLWRLGPGEGLWHFRDIFVCIVRHLQRHGVKAQPEETLRGGIDFRCPVVARRRSGCRHDCGRRLPPSHLREALLGGVSRDLLDHMTVPVMI